jgi:site-specific recombinase XerD
LQQQRQQQQNQDSNLAYRNFVDTCKTPSTRGFYIHVLNYFMSYLHLPSEGYDRLLNDGGDVKTTQMNICDYVTYLRNNGKSHQTVAAYLAAIRHFYDMNDVVSINWKKVHSFMGEHEKTVEDRPYTHFEISTMLKNTTMRNQGILQLLCSSGPRVGAISLLRMKDLEPVDKYDIYKVTYYPSSKKNCYFSFCSTETRKVIDAYLSWRERLGEKLKPESPLFRTEFNMLNIQHPQILTTKAIQFTINKLLKTTGIRVLIPPTELTANKSKRTHIMQCHGLRKFFETNAFRAGMDLIYVRRLMGQRAGLEDSYLKLSEEELLEGDSRHVGYIGIIDQLTINEENRLRREVQTLKVDKNKMEQVMERINILEDKILSS